MSADWEAELSFQIAGPQTLGGDGLAFWYAKDAGQEGPVFGSRDRWLGLGVFVDTYDNDGAHDNPRISVVANDGTRSYSPATDGRDIELGGCVAPLRRTAAPAGLLVRYDGATQRLRVEYSTAPGRWTECVAASVALPRGYRFGVSAATGALSDTHDIYRFVTRRLRSDDDDDDTPAAAAPAATAPAAATPAAAAPAPEPAAKNAEVEELRRQIEELRRAAQKPAPEEPAAPKKEEEETKEDKKQQQPQQPREEMEKKETPAPAAPAQEQKQPEQQKETEEKKKKEEEEDAVVAERLARLETAVRATATRAEALAGAAAELAAAERAAAALRVPDAHGTEGGAFDDAALRTALAQELLQLRRSVEQAQDAVRSTVGTHTDALRGRLAALTTALADVPADGRRSSRSSGTSGALMVVFVLVQAAFAVAMLQLFRQQGRQKKFL